MNVDDLKLELPEKIASQCIDEALSVWNTSKTIQLQYANSEACRKKSKWTYSSLIHAEQISAESVVEAEYLKNVYENVLISVPKLESINAAFSSVKLKSMKLKQLCEDDTRNSTEDKVLKAAALVDITYEKNYIAVTMPGNTQKIDSNVSDQSSSICSQSRIATVTLGSLSSINGNTFEISGIKGKPQQVLDVLLTQTVEELRDSIYCVIDHVMHQLTATSEDNVGDRPPLLLQQQSGSAIVDSHAPFFADSSSSSPASNASSSSIAANISNGKIDNCIKNNNVSILVIGGTVYVDSRHDMAVADYRTLLESDSEIKSWLTPLLLHNQQKLLSSGDRDESDYNNSEANDNDTQSDADSSNIDGSSLEKTAKTQVTKKRKIEKVSSSSLEYHIVPMNSTTCAQLLLPQSSQSHMPLLLGQVGVYWHCGGKCKHAFYFTDIHNFHPLIDLPLSTSYPRLLFHGKMARRSCAACKLWSARYVVYEDRLAFQSPLHLCQHCHYMLHYGKDGQLLYPFIVYPYIHD